MIEVSVEAIALLTQYYGQLLRCFTFRDFKLAPTIEEFEEILGCLIEGRKPYFFFWILPFYGESSRSIQDLRMRVRSSEAK